MDSDFKINKKDMKKSNRKTDNKINFMNLIKNDFLQYNNLMLYYDNRNNLNDNLFLKKIIDELMLLISKDYGKILLPFLTPPCHELLESYINSNLDEEENIKSIDDFKYINIFEELKKNIFISKENVSVIYSYFGDLYYDAKEIEQDDKRLLKFLKVKELWKIFYTLPNPNEIYCKSNFSFIGGNLIFKLKEEVDLKDTSINIKINFGINDKSKEIYSHKIFSLKINDKPINFNEYLKKIKTINNLKTIQFKVYKKFVEFSYDIPGKKKAKLEKISIDPIKMLETLTILEGYYGLVNSVEIAFDGVSNNEKFYYLYYPIPITKKKLCCIKNSKDNIIDLTRIPDKHILKFYDDNLIRVNYINYNEKNFNIIEYFGGITQLLPFVSLINNLFHNNKIKLINSQNKNDVLQSFISDILCSFINIILYYPEYNLNIKRYKLFFFCILTELDSFLLSKNEKLKNEILKFNDIIKDIEFLAIFGENDKCEHIMKLINEEKILFNNNDYFFGQLYTKLMKELFIFNQNWSKKDLFFNINKKDNKIAIKYKQLNYYTKSFQQPFIYPILENDKYYPKFNNFNIDKLFKNQNQKILNYDFSLNDNNIIQKTSKNIYLKIKAII